MGSLLDSFWRAAVYCLHPRVILLSLLPLVLMAGAAFGLGWLYWDAALETVRATLEGWSVLDPIFGWLQAVGLGNLKSALAPLIVVFVATPVIVVVALLVVAALMTPAMVELVARRRFPQLERKQGGSFWAGVLGGLGMTLLALLAIVLTLPLWLIPPLALVLPPLIWGWLTYRVLSYDVLAEHASVAERRELMKRQRVPLLAIGVLSGYLGAAPSIVWASGALFVAFAPLLIPAAIWIYTLVFAFAALWFAHHALAALEALRREVVVEVVTDGPAPTPIRPLASPPAPPPTSSTPDLLPPP